ncbi:hypothetical protein BH747_09885 [Enterococcus villorum]|uniref:Uncharacterized protein n=1 Tax=Enterococcus villorum TaxID=112904 RepID=A0A1V8YAB9_9ENTE|nr:hypothetical protein [Enterococcus villorum]OQO69571.1 hypothetical protein BH747_09885 [Enterococcus villorum]OQO72677.1 hypothetical protein BH744_11215 [Enterococcus villorum]
MASFSGRNEIDGYGVDRTIVKNFSKQIKALREQGAISYLPLEEADKILFMKKNYVEVTHGHRLSHVNYMYEVKDLNKQDSWRFNNNILKETKNRLKVDMQKI